MHFESISSVAGCVVSPDADGEGAGVDKVDGAGEAVAPDVTVAHPTSVIVARERTAIEAANLKRIGRQ